MPKVSIDLSDEVISSLVQDELEYISSSLKQDLQRGNVGIFSLDPVEDKKHIRKLIRATDLILRDFYGKA